VIQFGGLLDLFTREIAFDGVGCRMPDTCEILGRRGFEIASLGDRLARLRIGVDTGDDGSKR
jgi:hypothetical protein